MTPPIQIKSDSRALCLLINGLGDVVLALPALRAVSHCFGGNIAIVCGKGEARGLLREFGPERVHSIDTMFMGQTYRFSPSAILQRVGVIDTVFAFLSWHSESVDSLLVLSQARRSYGFFSSFTHQRKYVLDTHSVDLNFGLSTLHDSTLQLEEFAHPVALDSRAVCFAQQLLDEVPKGFTKLALHADTLRHKMLSPRTWVRFLDDLLASHGDWMVFVVGGRDLMLDDGPYRDRIVSCVDLSLQVNMAIVSASDAFIGVDSCMLHIADCFRVPLVGLFGPTPASAFGPRFSRSAVFQGNLLDVDPTDMRAALESLV